MKARAWGNGSNDVLEMAEIHFQGHLSCWNVFMRVTLACRRRGRAWTPGHGHGRASVYRRRTEEFPFVVIFHLLVVILFIFF